MMQIDRRLVEDVVTRRNGLAFDHAVDMQRTFTAVKRTQPVGVFGIGLRAPLVVPYVFDRVGVW